MKEKSLEKRKNEKKEAKWVKKKVKEGEKRKELGRRKTV